MKKALFIAAILLCIGCLAWVSWALFISGSHPRGISTRAALEFRNRLHSGLELGRLYQIDRAGKEFEACLRLDPESAEARFHHGRILMAHGNNAGALAEFNKALELAPEDTRLHRFLFDLHSGDRNLRDARKEKFHLEALRRICGDLIDFDLELHIETLGAGPDENFIFAMNRLRGMRGHLRSEGMLALHQAFFPHGEDHYSVQGTVLGVPGFQYFQKLFSRYPGLKALREAVAVKLVNPSRLGLPRTAGDRIPGSTIPLGLAQKTIEELFDFCPFNTLDSIFYFQALAVLDMKMGDYRAAASRLRWVLGLKDAMVEPFRIHNTFQLAFCHYKLGEFDEAREYFSKALAQEPGHLLASWFLRLLGDRTTPWREERLPLELGRGFVFQEKAAALGIAKRDAGGSSGWADYDLDGDLDLYVSGCDTYSILYRRENDRFVDASGEAGLRDVPSGFSNVFVDYDSDGDLDLFVARDGWAGPGPNSLYRNGGNGAFTEVTEPAGLGGGPQGSSFTCCWADFDRDGHLDLFVANGVALDGSTNRLFRNRGDGTFVDFTAAAGLAEKPGTRSIGCAAGDYDLDGWTDIFISGVQPAPNRLYRNRGDGTFEETAKRAGVDDSANAALGFVAFFADLDADALPDLFMVKWEEDFFLVLRSRLPGFQPTAASLRSTPRYFRNRGDGTFEDLSAAAGFIYPHGAMGAGIADLDNDGYLDIYLGNGGPDLERLEPDSLYVNFGGRRFIDAGISVGMGSVGKGHGVSFADFDGDGDLDVYVPLGGAFHGDMWENVFYLNEAGNRLHWLQVFLRGTRSNIMGVGAQVTARAGNLTVYREKTCGTGFGASDSPYLHFGLGENERVDSLAVRWPSGLVETFRDIPADRVILIAEGAGRWEEKSSRGRY